ncbi:MAG: NAD(P)/FAD-dependent oxidoreductase [Eubacterium sp.]
MTTIIIGAGASGLACAIRLKQNNPWAKVTVLERLDTVGKKLLATGNGRCNLSNTKAEEYQTVIDFFESLGLKTKADGEGRIYPYSNRAGTVVDILTEKCRELGIEIICSCTVKSVEGDLTVKTDCGDFKADCVVIACGGKSQKSLGSNGSGYELLQALGHTITPLYPGLVQLTSPSKYPRMLKGHRMKCNMSILLEGEKACEEYGEVLFTDYGLSGIVTMNLSQAVSKNFSREMPKKCHAVLDLIPDMSGDEVREYLSRFKSLNGILGKELAQVIEKQAQGDIEKTALFAKNWKLIVNGTKGFDFAQITCGGAKTDEFENYKSKLINNLYACGEVLDRQYPCGGFNLNHAFLSGIKTADNIKGN